MSDTLREIQKYHDGRYRSVDVVYLCGEIGNPDKERPFVPLDKVLEIIDDSIRYWTTENKWSIPVEWVKTSYETDRERILKLKRGEQE